MNNWEYDYTNLYNGASANNAQPAGGQQGQAAQPDPAVNTNPQPGADGGTYTSGSYQAGGYTGGGYGGYNAGSYNYGAPQPPKPPKRDHKWARRVGAAALALVFCVGAGFGGGYLGTLAAQSNAALAAPSSSASQAAVQDNANAVTPAPVTDSGSLTVSQIASKVGPSVVEVTTETATMNPYFGQYVQSGAGSGVIISQDGYIVTNNHVVSGASQIKVTTQDKQSYEATLIGRDEKTDVAVLKIDATGLTAAAIGDSDKLAVGEFALAVGNPLGTLGGTVTDGIISALDRDITVNNQTMTLLQTNAAVSPGNSGGGLFNAKGELIGIVNAKSGGSDVEGLGFAIPINTAMEVAESLIANGYVAGRPVLGVTVIAIDDVSTAMQYGVSQLGVYIAQVTEGGAAEKAGLQSGDLLVSIDGAAVSATADVTSILDQHSVGDTLEVQVQRDRQVLSFSVTLQESAPTATAQPADSTPAQQEEQSRQDGSWNPFQGRW